jgi:hypothetical protein
MNLSRQHVLADVESLTTALKALPPSAAVEKAIYHADRLHLAIRSSHNEGTRFAAFTVNKIVRDLGTEAPAIVRDAMARVRTALQSLGLDLSK